MPPPEDAPAQPEQKKELEAIKEHTEKEEEEESKSSSPSVVSLCYLSIERDRHDGWDSRNNQQRRE